MQERFLVLPVITMEPEGTLLFETNVGDLEEILAWISKYGPEAEIFEPEHCRHLMKERLNRWQQVYSQS